MPDDSRLPMAHVITIFHHRSAQTMVWGTATLAELAAMVCNTHKPHKDLLPLLKLGVFGELRTEKNCLRSNANLIEITGVEADNDHVPISFERGVEIMRAAPVTALIYTTPSNTDANPRWRVLCPTSRPLPRLARAGLMDRLNGIFGGIAWDAQSWTDSQTFYFGSVVGGEPVRAEIIEGDYIDLRDDIQSIGRSDRRVGKKKTGKATGEPLSVDMLVNMLKCITPDRGRNEWRDVVVAIRAAPVPDVEETDLRQLAHDWMKGELHDGLQVPGAHRSDEEIDRIFDRMPPGLGISVATIVKLARQGGYTGPISIAEQKRTESWEASIAAAQIDWGTMFNG
jgi:hypothetical protein